MLKKTLLRNTLLAVEQLEVAFEETLRTIDDINRRHRIVSARRQIEEQRQRLYESEIEAAITEPTLYTTLSGCPMKRTKRSKKRTVCKFQKGNRKSKNQAERPVMCLQANCFYEEEEEEDSGNAGIPSFEARLHQGDPEQFANGPREGSGRNKDSYQTDPKLCSRRTHCCPTCHCKTYYF